MQQRFLGAFNLYIETMPVQAERRNVKQVCPLSEFLPLRRENAGIRPIHALIEVCMESQGIPKEVMNHPALVSLSNDACDLVAIDNVSPF